MNSTSVAYKLDALRKNMAKDEAVMFELNRRIGSLIEYRAKLKREYALKLECEKKLVASLGQGGGDEI